MHKLAAKQSNAFFHLATVYNDLGEKDKGIENLQRAYEARDDRLVWIKVDPKLDNLRADSRFVDLLRQMNLAE